MAASVRNVSVCHTRSCCEQQPTNSEQKWTTLMHLLEKVSLVGLTALSVYASLELFIPFFLIGVAIGIYQYSGEKNRSSQTNIAPSCTQGVLEQITGVRLPAPVALAANVAITACHTVHHATVFVPIVALSVGVYVGKNATQCHSLRHRELSVHRVAHRST
ncbi:MAG: hypothetical protein WA347_06735 [Rhabdochlamydiaceae bacterium]|jgi:hypothetical protein